MSRITNDLLLLSELYHHGPEDYIKYMVRFVGAFVILFVINPSLTIAVFASCLCSASFHCSSIRY